MTERHWRIPHGDFARASRSRTEFLQILKEQAEPESRFDSAEIIFGELVVNAVRHAQTSATVTLTLAAIVRLRVSDDGASGWQPQVQPAAPQAIAGRGLYIVSVLARSLEFEKLSPGLAVSVALPVFLRLR